MEPVVRPLYTVCMIDGFIIVSASRYPQASFPQLCITAAVVPGISMGDIGDQGERFLANQRITGPIAEMLDAAVDFVRRNGRIKRKTAIPAFRRSEKKLKNPI